MFSKMIFFSLVLFPLNYAYSQVLWSVQIPSYGSGDSEGTAYLKAEQNLRQEFAYRKGVCQKQAGNFSARMQRSFCDPYDPSTLFNSQTCLVIGYASCQSDPVVVQETVEIKESAGNQNQAIDPGEKVELAVTLTNSSQRPLSNIQISVAMSGEQPILSLQESELVFGNLKAGESKTITFNGVVLPTIPCGSRVMLTFVAMGTGFQYRFTRPLLVGKLTEKPITLEGKSLPLNAKGVSYMVGEVPGPEKEVSQLILSYNASVRIPSKYRFWVTTPSGQPIWAYFGDESRTEISFSRDLTEFLKNAKTSGKWHLSGDMGNGNTAVIKDFKLVIVPNSYACEK